MKITASKKTIVILSISFILLLLVAGLSFFYRDIISNGFKYGRWFVLDKYEELLDDCDYVKTKDTVEVKCNALVRAVRKTETGHCHNLLIIGPDTSKKLYETNICERDEKIDTENVKYNHPMLIPVKVKIVYNKKDVSPEYSFNNATMKNIDDLEILDLLEKDPRLKALSDRIDRKYYDINIYNYFYFPEEYILSFYGLQPINFVSADLEGVSIEDEYLVVRIRTLVRNQEVVLQSKIKGFNYLDDGTNQIYYITPENLDDFANRFVGRRIIPNFYYSQRQRTAEEKDRIFNTYNYTGDNQGVIELGQGYAPLCNNWDLYASLETEGVLTKDAYANFILSQEDLNNVDINLISPFSGFTFYP
ncbi:MAG: hypothetical protein ACOX06_03700 [Candidatus Dojkabacteria bacterium]